MVTTANGTGVPVLDFLCLTQSRDMMRAIFRQALEWNPGALERVRSIVIDKDYNEWAVLEEVFINADVVLCQFHVLKWFKHAIGKAKYNLTLARRERVMAVLRAQVYAVDDEEFEHQQMLLADLLSSQEHRSFLEYMHARWYSCVKMWSYAGRGKIFTAYNTTTNRLESFWRHLKAILGDKQRIDLCIEAIFTQATTVLRREKKYYVNHASKPVVHYNLDPFLAPLFRELSKYAAGLVREQYDSFKSGGAIDSLRRYFAQRLGVGSRRFAVRVVGQSTTEDEVDIGGLGPWTCSCSFYQGCLLPCRHLFYVASTQEGLAVYPLKALALRWNLSAAASLINSLQTAVVDMASLRIPRKRKRHAAARAVVSAFTSEEGDSAPYSELDDDWANSANDQLADVGRVVEGVGRVRVRPVASMTLRRGEAANGVVIGDIEKRNAVLAQIEPLKTYLIAQGTARFWTLAIELDSVLKDLVKSWLLDEASIHTTSANATTISTNATSVTATSTNATTSANATASANAASSANATSVTTTSGGEGDTSVDGSQFDDLPELPDYNLPELTDYDNDTDEEVDDMEPRRFVFAEDIGTSFSMSEPVLSMSPAPIRHVRFPRVHSPLASPSSFQVYGDLDLNDDVRSIMQDAVTRHVLPLAPPPHIFREFNSSRPSCSMKDAPSVRELIAEVDDGEGMDGIAQGTDSHGAMNRSFETSIDDTLVTYSPSTADPDHDGLRAIDEELAAEQALRFPLLDTSSPLLDTPSRNTRGAKRKRDLSDVGHSQGHSREKQNTEMSPMQPTRALQPSPSTSPTQPTRALQPLPSTATPTNWVAPNTVSVQPVPFLQGEVNEVEGLVNSIGSKAMRTTIQSVLERSTLETVLCVPGGGCRITMKNIIGRLGRSAKLNDAVVNFSLALFASAHDDAVIIDSLNYKSTSAIPVQALKDTRVVVFPINMGDNAHWGLICVSLPTHPGATAFLYDPLAGPWQPNLKVAWREWCMPLLEAWAARDEMRTGAIVDLTQYLRRGRIRHIDVNYPTRPKQLDGKSCGLFTILQGFVYITDEYELQNFDSLNPFQVKQMRLRLLWYILTNAEHNTDPLHVAAAMKTMQAVERRT
jgi:hypothetical protein